MFSSFSVIWSSDAKQGYEGDAWLGRVESQHDIQTKHSCKIYLFLTWWHCAELWRRRDKDIFLRAWPGESRVLDQVEYKNCQYEGLKHTVVMIWGTIHDWYSTTCIIHIFFWFSSVLHCLINQLYSWSSLLNNVECGLHQAGGHNSVVNTFLN